ncbi:PBECR2 nuclease fold domain-containing protein [Anthocerotibacter panamensis]|uniref:PBECR2 nuclease fold domain-containing protein n=1 Tax=Anthocerotibacter panamensis TaxID=2857077 RepID=UPI001C40190E|nr:PBECR2 nuclease fold domain-containing protein [Anthocerotibacter panamensis]
MDAPQASQAPEARNESEVRAIFTKVLGGDRGCFIDPTGEPIWIDQTIVDHILEKEKRLDGREKVFPFIPEVIQDPFEVWVSSARNEETDEIGVRRRYVKYLAIDKPKYVALVVQKVGDLWIGFTVFRGTKASTLNNLRKGTLIWGRELVPKDTPSPLFPDSSVLVEP